MYSVWSAKDFTDFLEISLLYENDTGMHII